MAIEIVDLPMKNVIFHSYVSLPEGIMKSCVFFVYQIASSTCLSFLGRHVHLKSPGIGGIQASHYSNPSGDLSQSQVFSATWAQATGSQRRPSSSQKTGLFLLSLGWDRGIISIGSMVLVYMLTKMVYIDGKCCHICHTWILWNIEIMPEDIGL